MTKWFEAKSKPSTQTKLSTNPQVYPTHICIHTPKGYYFINSDNKRYKIDSLEVLKSWAFPFVVETTEEAVVNYPVALVRLALRNGTLVYNIKDARLYLVSDSKLRHVVGAGVLTRLGLTAKDALVVSDSDIKSMRQGSEIS